MAAPSYTLTYNSNGSSESAPSPTSGSGALTVAAAITRACYTFTGWNTAANGSGVNIPAGSSFSPASDLTLYAQWTTDTSGGISAYVSPPFVQGPDSSFAATVETFDAWTIASPLTSFPASGVGTFSGRVNVINGAPSGVDYGGATVATAVPTVGGTGTRFAQALGSGNTLTLTFAGCESRYVGFWWSAGSSSDTVKFYSKVGDSDVLVGTFTTATLLAMLGGSTPSPYPGSTVVAVDGTSYPRGYYFGAPK